MINRVLVFDMDGVLVDVSDSYRAAIQRTVEYFTRRKVSRELIQDFKNQGGWNNDWELSHKLIRDMGREVPYDDVVERFQTIFLGNGGDGLIAQERWIARPGLLEGFSERYRLAIFTGRLRMEVRATFSRFGIRTVFDPIITSEDDVAPKPSPEGLARIAELTCSNALWYVGDAVDDARSARAIRVPFIGIASPANPRNNELAALLRAEGAIAVLDDINQLEKVLPA